MRQGLWVIILLSSLGLSACGFQLRDQYALPDVLRYVHLDASSQSDFTEIAAARLSLAGVTLVADANGQPSPAVIQILDDSLDRRALSLSASGQVAEYELIYSVRYALHRQPGADPILGELEVHRDYQDDPNFALAKTREREVLLREMREEAARTLLRQVVAAVAE